MQQGVRPSHLPLVAEPALVSPALPDPPEVDSGTPVVRPDLNHCPGYGIPGAVHAGFLRRGRRDLVGAVVLRFGVPLVLRFAKLLGNPKLHLGEGSDL